MAVGNRLTVEQLAALAPGDTVTIESPSGFGRRHTNGTVARVEGPHVIVSVRTARGGRYVERYRDGVRVGSGNPAELVSVESGVASGEEGRRMLRVDTLYRRWARNRGDREALRHLHAEIGELLGDVGA